MQGLWAFVLFLRWGALLEGFKQKGEVVGFTSGTILSATVLRRGRRAQVWKQGIGRSSRQ